MPSPPGARLAGLVVALDPGLWLYAALVMSEPLAALLTLVAFWLAVRDARPERGLVAGALALGAAALVRPQALFCAPFLGWVVPRTGAGSPRRPWDGAWWRPWAAAAAACAITLVPVLPWTARNLRVMDGFALVSTNAGWNLAIGAFPRATGRFETLRSSDGCRDVTGQVQQDRCWLAYGVQQIREQPWHWLSLVPAKLKYTFDHESFAVEYLHEARPGDWPEERRSSARDATTLLHRLLLAASAFGCIAFPLARRRRDVLGRSLGPLLGTSRALTVQTALLVGVGALAAFAFASEPPIFWPLAIVAAVVPWLPLPGAPGAPLAMRLAVVLLATTLVTHAVFFGEDRYHIVVTPVLALLAAGALRRPTRDFFRPVVSAGPAPS